MIFLSFRWKVNAKLHKPENTISQVAERKLSLALMLPHDSFFHVV